MDELIDFIYESVYDSLDWQLVLDAVRERFGAREVAMYTFNSLFAPRTRAGDVASPAADSWTFVPPVPDQRETIRAELLRAAAQHPAQRQRTGRGTSVRRVRVAGASGVLAHGTSEAIHVVLGLFGQPQTSNPRRTTRDLHTLLPHLCRVLRVRRRVDLVAARASSLERACERLAVGVLQTDKQARPLWANTATRDMLADGSVLSVQDGRLAAPRREDTRRLHELIAGLHAHHPSEQRRLRLAVVHHGNRRVPFLVFVVPADGAVSGAPGGLPGAGAATIFLIDPARGGAVSPALLARIFPFTPAESVIAARMLSGLSLARIAEQQGINRETVRQHLKHIFEKTATHRQAELMVVLSGAVSWLRGTQSKRRSRDRYPNG